VEKYRRFRGVGGEGGRSRGGGGGGGGGGGEGGEFSREKREEFGLGKCVFFGSQRGVWVVQKKKRGVWARDTLNWAAVWKRRLEITAHPMGRRILYTDQ
jgi:hypothetical protein